MEKLKELKELLGEAVLGTVKRNGVKYIVYDDRKIPFSKIPAHLSGRALPQIMNTADFAGERPNDTNVYQRELDDMDLGYLTKEVRRRGTDGYIVLDSYWSKGIVTAKPVARITRADFLSEYHWDSDKEGKENYNNADRFFITVMGRTARGDKRYEVSRDVMESYYMAKEDGKIDEVEYDTLVDLIEREGTLS